MCDALTGDQHQKTTLVMPPLLLQEGVCAKITEPEQLSTDDAQAVGPSQRNVYHLQCTHTDKNECLRFPCCGGGVVQNLSKPLRQLCSACYAVTISMLTSLTPLSIICCLDWL
mmetsp:Transcript_63866/g.161890  ORF Transcript_63866/g.161890 Transcript_63866/m.161890 type:complete len:113 (+) Transcript_63866:117-455(+)